VSSAVEHAAHANIEGGDRVMRSAAGFVCGSARHSYGQMGDLESAEEAARFADLVGYPVVLKIDDPDIPHKSEVGEL